MPARSVGSRRTIPVALGVGLLASFAVALHAGAADRSARDPELANFRLVDAAGRAYSIDSFAPDTVLAIYFGYTTCLRACPVALDNIAAAMDDLGPQSASVQPVFVDMDPERVDPVNLRMYLESFGSRFLGLTGPAESVAEAAKSFKVQVERLQFSADPSDYTMTHLSPIFVMRPNDPQPLSLAATSSPEIINAALQKALHSKAL